MYLQEVDGGGEELFEGVWVERDDLSSGVLDVRRRQHLHELRAVELFRVALLKTKHRRIDNTAILFKGL